MARRRRRRRRSAPRTITRYRYRSPARRRRRSSGGILGGGSKGKQRAIIAGTAAVYGKLLQAKMEDSTVEASIKSKVPGAATIGVDAVVGLAAHFLAKQFRSRVLDHVSTAALAIAGYKFGKADFSLAAMEGIDLDTELSGVVDVDEAAAVLREAAEAEAEDGDDDDE